MTRPDADVALLTDRRYAAPMAASGDWYLGNILADDGLLAAALSARGLASRRVAWDDPTVDWRSFRAAVFRTTWDYAERFGEFAAWLPRVAAATRLVNPSELVAWNLDKHYLAELTAAAVPVVTTTFLERGTAADLGGILRDRGWEEGVVKPCVSAGARHTHRFTAATAEATEAVITPLLAEEAFLVQPFERRVLVDGEDSLMVFGGRVTHAVRKLGAAGDFRVQDDFGGTVRPSRPEREQVELALRAVAACPRPPAYARVDMVRSTLGGWRLMELELVEPEVWLRLHPPAADAFATALAATLDAPPT